MAYSLHAIFVGSSNLKNDTPEIIRSAFIELPQSLLMLPISEAMWNENISKTESRDNDWFINENYFEPLPNRLTEWMKSITDNGVIACVFIECWGGPCDRRVLVLKNGGLLWDRADEDSAPGYEIRHSPKPFAFFRRLLGLKPAEEQVVKINRTILDDAFDELGVDAGQHFDAFDALGLGQYRNTEDWLDQK